MILNQKGVEHGIHLSGINKYLNSLGAGQSRVRHMRFKWIRYFMFEIGDFLFQFGFQKAAFRLFFYIVRVIVYYLIVHLEFFNLRWSNVTLPSYGFYDSCGMIRLRYNFI